MSVSNREKHTEPPGCRQRLCIAMFRFLRAPSPMRAEGQGLSRIHRITGASPALHGRPQLTGLQNDGFSRA